MLGVDAAGKHGWVGILLDRQGYVAAHLGTLPEVIRWGEPVTTIAVDIPIGNVPGGGRRADVDARRFVGPRSASVFTTPPLEIVEAVVYAQANETLAAMGAAKVSRQAWSLVPKMAEAAMVAATDPRVFEVHPEVSFRELAGEHLAWSKKSWNGLLLRRRLLGSAGIVLPDVIPDLEDVVSDDVVDAAAAAWSALRIAAGTKRSFPDPPEEVDGRQVAIWC